MNQNISDLEFKIKQAQELYYNGESIIDDEEYDSLVYKLSLLDPNNILLNSVGAKANNEWIKEKHSYPLGSLNKINYPDDMSNWINNKLLSKDVLVVEKLDGLSIGCQYENGTLIKSILRGDAFEGEDILSNVLKMEGVIKYIPGFSGVLRGEIILKKSVYKKYLSNYSNPRNASSGICRELEGTNCKYLTLMFYQVYGKQFNLEEEQFDFLKQSGCLVPNYKLCKISKDVNSLWKEYQDSIRESLDYEIDGIVVNANDIEFQNSLGETNLRPKGKMAFKFANQFAKSIILDMSWVCGNSGRITPVCWFEKTNLLGSNIEKASVYNIAYINKLGLGIGSEVLVCKANEIIPRVEKVLTKGTEIQIPVNCPSCNSKLKMIGENLQCLNKSKCPAQVVGKVKNWIEKLNILEFGETLTERLVESKLVLDPADLYKLSLDDLASIERMGEKSAENCLNSLNSRKEVTLDVLVGSLSIPMNSDSSIRMVMAGGINTLDKLFNVTLQDLINIDGIGEIKAQHLIDGLIDNKDLIYRLLDNGIILKEPNIGKLTGMSFCFSGALSQKRSVFENMVSDNGGEVKNSVGKSLTYLILADPSSASSKAVKAAKNGTKVISEQEFFNLLK